VEWTHKLETAYEVEVDMHIATPPYQTDDIECKGYWLKPDGHTPEKRVKSLKSQTNGALIVFLQEVERTRPRLIIGLGQGAVVVGVGSFPVILERACRDRAVTQQQMESFRKAWSGVTSLLLIDPTILPTSNNHRTLPFDMLKQAFPAMDWAQPRDNERGVFITNSYMTPPFAQELGSRMGAPVEFGKLPGIAAKAEAIRKPMYAARRLRCSGCLARLSNWRS
jgi:hypothetical protein